MASCNVLMAGKELKDIGAHRFLTTDWLYSDAVDLSAIHCKEGEGVGGGGPPLKMLQLPLYCFQKFCLCLDE